MTALADPVNERTLLEVRAARAWGVPVSTIRGGAAPGRWTHTDRALAVALVMVEDQATDRAKATCSGCGHPLWESTHDDMDGFYDVTERTCYGCAAILDHRKDHQCGPECKPAAVNTRPAGAPPLTWLPFDDQ